MLVSDVEIIYCSNGYPKRIYADRRVVYNLMKNGYSLYTIFKILSFKDKEETGRFKTADKLARYAQRRFKEALAEDGRIPLWFSKVKILCDCNYERIQTQIMQEEAKSL